MGLGDTISDDSSNDDSEQSTRDQSKSLIANTYSNRGRGPNGYKSLDDWGLSDEEIEIAFGVTSTQNGSGSVRNFVKGLVPSKDHEEFYSKLQLAIAHSISTGYKVNELEASSIDSRGSVPLMEMFHISAGDMVQYMKDNPQVAADLIENGDDIQEIAEEAETDEEN